MTPFEWLLVGHLVGDMVIGQTEAEALNKSTNWRRCITHALKWTATLGVAAALAGWRGEPTFGLLLLVMGALHAVIDRRWPVVWVLRRVKGVTGDPPGWLVMWVDQVLHVVQVAVLALALR